MFNGGNGISLADIAAVTRGNNGNNGFGGDGGGWWALIILLALFGGFDGNGFGNRNNGGGNNCCGNGGSGTNYVVADVQRGFDNAGVISKLDAINSGICSLGYDQLAQMNGINTNIMQTGYGIMQAINGNTVANMQNTNALSTQLANCCCENRAAIAQVRYDMATDTCAITTAINNAAQNIIQNTNEKYRALHDENIQVILAQKDEKISEQASLIQSLNLAQSQANQNNWLVSQLRPSPSPAYVVPNPFCCNNNNNGCGNNSCCA